MYKYEQALMKEGYRFIAGCDEAGRGPLAGPLVAAAVVLDPDKRIEGLFDSKQLSDKKRRELSEAIRKSALSYEIKVIDSVEVDRLNVYQASKQAMRDAVLSLPEVDHILTDAMPLTIGDLPSISLIKGDTLSASIAAASILAKVTRDDYMMKLGEKHPHYGFETHKGYPTKRHLDALRDYGVIGEHRRSFAPVRKIIETQLKMEL